MDGLSFQRNFIFSLIFLITTPFFSSVYALTTIPAGYIDGVTFHPTTGYTSIAGWACNPNQTYIRIWLKEQGDSDFRLHRQIKANDFARPDVVAAGICDGSTNVYGYHYTRMVLSPGTYYFKLQAREPLSPGQDPFAENYVPPPYEYVGNIYGPVTIAEEPARTSSVSNGTLKVRLDKMRGGLIDNIIDVTSGKHWLVNDADGRGMGTSGIVFGNNYEQLNNLKFNEALVVETGGSVVGDIVDCPTGQCIDSEDQILGDWGNQSLTVAKGSNYIWGKAHTTSWAPLEYEFKQTFVYNQGTSLAIPTLPAESTASVPTGTSGTAIRFDHEVAFTASNPNIIRVRERVRNHSGEAVKPVLWNPPNCERSTPGCYPWPFTNQIHVNRFMLTTQLPWYYKNNGVWTYLGTLPTRYGWLQYHPTNPSETDLKWVGPSGVVVGASGGAVGLKCHHQDNSPLHGYYVGDLGGSGGILMMAPYWGNKLKGLSGPGETLSWFGNPIPDGGSQMSYCYFAFSRASNAVSVVQTALDNATYYSWSGNTGF